MLSNLICFLISFFSTIIGAISGIGGGIIIKPMLDGIGTFGMDAIRFYSGCTVLCMSVMALVRNGGGADKINWRVSTLLALGACLGGFLGKELFRYLFTIFARSNAFSILQSVLLLAINVGVFVYLKNKKRIVPLCIGSPLLRVAIGLSLGLISSFLGIGGGPINIAALYYFFSMQPKETALNSLYIIFFSQLTSLVGLWAAHEVPDFSSLTLFVMCGGGVAGAITGSAAYKKLTQEGIEKFFSAVMIFLMALNVYNVVKLLV